MTDSGEPLLIAVTQITWHLGNIFTVKTTGIYELYAQTCINDEANAVVFCDALTTPLRVSDQKMNISPKMWNSSFHFAVFACGCVKDLVPPLRPTIPKVKPKKTSGVFDFLFHCMHLLDVLHVRTGGGE